MFQRRKKTMRRRVKTMTKKPKKNQKRGVRRVSPQ